MGFSRSIFTITLATLLFLTPTIRTFYVPGVAPVDFHNEEDVEVKAVKMTSSRTQLPYDYYTIPQCQPKEGGLVYKSENLGEILRGDRIVNTPYKVYMKKDSQCTIVCKSKFNADESKRLYDFIQKEYSVHLLVDNLPCATKFQMIDTKEEKYERGYRLGFFDSSKTYINNHLEFHFKYHNAGVGDDGQPVYNVVGFEVYPKSYSHQQHADGEGCELKSGGALVEVKPGTSEDIIFSYSVKWFESDISWTSRWDIYLNMGDAQIHWFSIVNSIVVVFFLAGILTMIIIRTLRRDIAQYNSAQDYDETLEETGWKLVHGDVFRPPRYSKLLSSLIGSGLQIFGMSFVTIGIAMFGMLSPSSRGKLLSTGLFLFMFMGLVAGYSSARLYKTLKGVEWKKAALLTANLYPGVMFLTTFILNLFIWGKRSSGAMPIPTLFGLLCMWFGISVPLVFLGYYFGYRKQPYQYPVRINQIPRQVPEQAWYMNPVLSMLMAGILPFGAMFIELFFIFSALWENQFYYLFGFLFLVFIILIVACSQISIVMCYFQLCGEDYHWWWRSFLVSGGSAIYVFAYSIFYFITKLEIIGFVPTLLYFGYTSLIVLTFWILTGTIGFYAAYFFVRRIYAAVKID